MPQGGFGNLIALPLQKRARELGNSVFLDDRLDPYADQWSYLSTVRRIARSTAESIVSDAERKGRVVGVRLVPLEDEAEPWTLSPSGRPKGLAVTGPLPERLDIVLANQVYIAKEHLSPSLRNRLVRLAAFQNPEFRKAQAMRLSTFGKPRIVACAEDHPQHIGLPRGCLRELLDLLSDLKIQVDLRDERFRGTRLAVQFQGRLQPEQEVAAKSMLSHDTGVLSAATAFGKTIVAAWLIAQRGVNTLVLVHRRQLLEQWVHRLSTFLDLPMKAVGRIGGGRRKPTGLLDVGLIQSLSRKGVVDDLVADYGHIVVDECHHLSAPSFEQIMRRAKAKFVTGLSATVTRKDGHHPIIFMQCGPIRHQVAAKVQAAGRPFEHTVLVRPTAFQTSSTDEDSRVQFQQLYAELIGDDSRNETICQDVLQSMREGRSPLVLTERGKHLEDLTDRLSPQVQHLIVLRGGMGKKQVEAVESRLADIPDNEARVILATGRYIGEGFDDARLDTLFLTLPVSWRGTIAQYVGRLHRLHHGKREVRVYDYADLGVPMLSRMFDKRCHGYAAVGYRILLPGSAVPGRPPEVSLPIDPQWKSRYAASVRRLIQDGVDTPWQVYSRRRLDRRRRPSKAAAMREAQPRPSYSAVFRLSLRRVDALL